MPARRPLIVELPSPGSGGGGRGDGAPEEAVTEAKAESGVRSLQGATPAAASAAEAEPHGSVGAIEEGSAGEETSAEAEGEEGEEDEEVSEAQEDEDMAMLCLGLLTALLSGQPQRKAKGLLEGQLD